MRDKHCQFRNPPGNTGGARPDAGSKRKDVPQAQGAGRAFKRVKVQDARSIRSQPADAALKDGELDLQAFLNARQFEIGALQDGMRKSKALNNRRAFQLVPREMRRRTASHNVKKLPKRLRNRARREQLQDNTPTVVAGKRKPKTTRARIRLESAKRLGILAEKKRKRKLREAKAKAKAGGGSAGAGGKEESSAAFKQLIETRPPRPKIRRNLLNDPPKPKAKFRKRQIEKTWLPTHLWHAKRARMTLPKEPLWRFAIPLTPNEKSWVSLHKILVYDILHAQCRLMAAPESTNAGADWEVEQRAKRKADWAKRPKSKRVAWDSLDLGAGRKGEIGTGWACEFEKLFGLQQPEEDPSSESKDLNADGAVTNVSEDTDKMDVDGGEAGSAQDDQSGTAEGELAVKRISKKTQAPHPLTLIRHLPKHTFNTLVSAKSNEAPPLYSIVTIKITILGRGVAEPCARIYRLPARKDPPLPGTQPEVPATQPPSQGKEVPADLRDQWLAQVHGSLPNRHSSSEKKVNQPRRFPAGADFETQKLLLAQTLLTNKSPLPPEKVPGGSGDHPLVPGEEDLIGYVTKGEFCLTQGQAVAIGSISAERALEALRSGA
ncbi:putative popld domain-containing protein [Diaporthe ampelina]|uniref:Putative popld domain-containing protein n=1 Tax=Diaporthe ampelina TaxID=1214573 RepID=A0A0G2FZI3_9PEZI|nr:putative popld domain-containing protein [Diaporthe ampelina]